MLRFTVVCSEKSGEIIYKKEKKVGSIESSHYLPTEI